MSEACLCNSAVNCDMMGAALILSKRCCFNKNANVILRGGREAVGALEVTKNFDTNQIFLSFTPIYWLNLWLK